MHDWLYELDDYRYSRPSLPSRAKSVAFLAYSLWHSLRWTATAVAVCSSIFFYLWQRRRYMFLPVFVCLSVCEQDYTKRHALIWMNCCVSTDVGTWTNWLTFEPDADYSPDAGTGLLSPTSYALQRGIYYVRIIPRTGIGTRTGRCSDAWF